MLSISKIKFCFFNYWHKEIFTKISIEETMFYNVGGTIKRVAGENSLILIRSLVEKERRNCDSIVRNVLKNLNDRNFESTGCTLIYIRFT